MTIAIGGGGGQEGIFDERHKPLTLIARRSPPRHWKWSVAAEIGPSKKKKFSLYVTFWHELGVGTEDFLALVYIMGKNVCNQSTSNDLRCQMILLMKVPINYPLI